MVLRPSSRSQTTRPTSLADVYGGAFHNLSIMSNSKMPNIEAQSDSSLGDDLAPIAHPGHRDIERTFLAHHQHLIRPIWKCFRKTHGQVLERTLPDPEKAGSWNVDCQQSDPGEGDDDVIGANTELALSFSPPLDDCLSDEDTPEDTWPSSHGRVLKASLSKLQRLADKRRVRFCQNLTAPWVLTPSSIPWNLPKLRHLRVPPRVYIYASPRNRGHLT